MASVAVLRLGHRIPRDDRMTTHVALTARAFGADKILVDREDKGLEKSIRSVVSKFGGSFQIETGVDWRRFLREWRGTVVHLTMYGERLEEIVGRIPKGDLLIVVGSEKVRGEVFDMAHFNVAVGNQPHSEVAALAVFLDRYLEGKGLKREFEGKIRIVPSKKGKVVVERGDL